MQRSVSTPTPASHQFDSQPLTPGLSNARGFQFQSLRDTPPPPPSSRFHDPCAPGQNHSRLSASYSSSSQPNSKSSSPVDNSNSNNNINNRLGRNQRDRHHHSQHHHSIAAAPLHRNVFYESGVEHAPNPLMHYIHVGVWYSHWCDYYLHRRPVSGDIRGRDVLWLHNARPRDRFVFLVRNVDGGTIEGTLMETVKQWVYGAAPRFAIEGRKNAAKSLVKKAPGVEILEILHCNITAIDYSAGLVSSRFAVEAREVICTWFATEQEARETYGCSLGATPVPSTSSGGSSPHQQQQQNATEVALRQSSARAASLTPPILGSTSRSASPVPASTTSSAAAAAAAFATSARHCALPLSNPATPSLPTAAISSGSGSGSGMIRQGTVPYNRGPPSSSSSTNTPAPPSLPRLQYQSPELLAAPPQQQQQQQQRKHQTQDPCDYDDNFAPPPPTDDNGIDFAPLARSTAHLPPLSMPPSAAAAIATSGASAPSARSTAQQQTQLSALSSSSPLLPFQVNAGREPATASELAALTPTPAFSRDQSMQWSTSGSGTGAIAGAAAAASGGGSKIWCTTDPVAEAAASAAAGTPPPALATAAQLTSQQPQQPSTNATPTPGTTSAITNGNNIENGSVAAFSQQNNSNVNNSDPIVISSTIVTMFTQDPNFAAVIREIVLPGGSPTNEGLGVHEYTGSVDERLRLLRLVEAGIPSWCIFSTRYGIFYRRSLRVIVGIAINFWPLVALGLGLYDLYSHMPYVHQYLVPLFSLFEDSLPFRVALYVAYFFTYVLYFMQWVATSLKSVFAVLEFLVLPFAPLVSLLWPVVSLVMTLLQSGYALLGTLMNLIFGKMMLGTVMALFSPLIALFKTAPTSTAAVGAAASSMPQFVKSFVTFWRTVASPIKNVLKSTYDGIIHVGSLAARHEASLRMAFMERARSVQEFLAEWSQWISLAVVVAMALYWLPEAVGWILGSDRSSTSGLQRQVLTTAVSAASSSSWSDAPLSASSPTGAASTASVADAAALTA